MSENVTSENRPRRHYHHGRSPAAWAGTIPVIVAGAVGMVGFLLPGGVNWMLVGVAAAIIVVALIAAIVLRELGFGQK